MTAFTERINRAADAASCQFLSAAGGSLVTAGVWGASTGAGAGWGLATMGLGGAALLAANLACPDGWDPDGENTLPTTGGALIEPGSCLKTDGCFLEIRDKNGSQVFGDVNQELVSVVLNGFYPNGEPKMLITVVDCQGVLKSDDEPLDRAPIRTQIKPGGNCTGDPAPPQGPIEYDFTTTINDGPDCNINVTLQGFADGGGGRVGPVWKIEPAPGAGRAGGGVISGCNFEPVIQWNPGGDGGSGGGGGNGPIIGPFPPDPDEPGPPGSPPPWVDALQDLITGIAANVITDALEDALAPPVPGTVYRVNSICEVDEDGEPVSLATEIPIGSAVYQSAVLQRLDAVAALLQPLKDYKQPICRERPELKGDFRTISFISDERSAFGDGRLRKRFRYRSQSGIGLDQLVAHWADFVWNAGPVCVQHSGHSWGTPQVWAASATEGKRVIQHAGREAGVDPDQVGQWTVSGSNNPRFGMSGTMRVNTKGGYYWVTERLGSNARPLVMRT